MANQMPDIENKPKAISISKIIFIIIIFIVCVILTAYAFSSFFFTEQKVRYGDCILLQNKKTGEVGCFGCYNDICKDASIDWEPYQNQQIGIPYACFKNETGCQLAQ